MDLELKIADLIDLYKSNRESEVFDFLDSCLTSYLYNLRHCLINVVGCEQGFYKQLNTTIENYLYNRLG